MSSPLSLSYLAAAAGAAASPESPPFLLTIAPFIGMGVIFWLLIIRPQMRRQKEHRAKVAGIKKGDQVVTAGGLLGKVLKVDDHYVDLELGTNVRVKAVKSTIGDIVPPTGAAPAND